jgi:hypothetical protein
VGRHSSRRCATRGASAAVAAIQNATSDTLIRKMPNQALERTAIRRVFTFQMIKTVSVEAAPALSGGGSDLSR